MTENNLKRLEMKPAVINEQVIYNLQRIIAKRYHR